MSRIAAGPRHLAAPFRFEALEEDAMSHMHIREIERLILRKPSAKLTSGNFLRGGLLRHHAQLPLLDKRPRQ